MHASQDMSGFSDTRSATKDVKRVRDNKHKWEHGGRPGCGARIIYDNTVIGPEGQAKTVRPVRRWNKDPWIEYNTNHNVNKGRGWALSGTRGRAILHVFDELRDTDNRTLATELPPIQRVSKLEPDSAFYSFDAAASPLRPVPLEVFMKTTGRETEKLVEKEYEILDDKGDIIKGRMARRTLRRSEKAADDDGLGGYEFV